MIFFPFFCIPQPHPATLTRINRPAISHVVLLLLLLQLHPLPRLQRQNNTNPSKSLCLHLPYPGTSFRTDNLLLVSTRSKWKRAGRNVSDLYAMLLCVVFNWSNHSFSWRFFNIFASFQWKINWYSTFLYEQWIKRLCVMLKVLVILMKTQRIITHVSKYRQSVSCTVHFSAFWFRSNQLHVKLFSIRKLL